jgi:hypothetical protein
VDPGELDNALEELETRVERLRALYEQYFLGIEKVEPSVARKDVERRIWMLRRVQIRNTGKRFKLNTIIQRYNTFQQYWQRICREIENGTYRRHLLRASKNLEGKDALTIAARKRVRMLERGAQMAAQRAAAAAAGADEVEQSLQEQLCQPSAGTLNSMDEIRRAMDEALGSSCPPAEAKSGLAQASIPLPPALPAEAQRSKLPAVDLELDEGLAQPPRAASTPAGPSSGQTHGARPTPVQPFVSASPAPCPRSPGPRSPPPPPAAGIAQNAELRNQRPLAGRPLPAPKSRLSQAKRPPDIQAGGPTLSDQRVRQLYTELVEAKQRTNDSARVSEEGLARSLRAAEAKLRQQHGSSRQVDFDIVIKNGKAVVKPIVR